MKKSAAKFTVFVYGICLTSTIAQTPTLADDFARSGYYSRLQNDPDSNASSKRVLNLDGIPEDEQEFYKKFFPVLDRYIAIKKLLLQSLRAKTATTQLLRNYKQIAPLVRAELASIQDLGSVSTHARVAVVSIIDEQIRILESSDTQIAGNKSLDDLLQTPKARDNQAKLLDLWLLISNKYDNLTPLSKNYLKRTLEELSLDERLRLN